MESTQPQQVVAHAHEMVVLNVIWRIQRQWQNQKKQHLRKIVGRFIHN